jgi:hypothetical protein
MPVIFNKCYAIFSKMPFFYLLSTRSIDFHLQACGLNSITVKKWLDSSGTEKVCSYMSFFGPFRSTTGPFKGFKKSRWNIVQLRS